MKMTMILGFILVLLSAGSAAGELITRHLASDAELINLLPEDRISFTAEGRIGDLGGAATFELDLGRVTSAPAVTRQYAWQSGVTEPFTISYDAVTHEAVFSLGGETLVYEPTMDFADIFIRTRAVDGATSMVVDNLVLNGESILDLSSAIGADGRDILWIEIEGWLLSDGFVLTGDAVLSWLVTPPAHSRLAFQIKVGTPTEHSAMAPTTWGSIKRLYQ